METKQNTINILCATDKNFVPFCGIMLTSVFENNKTERVCAYVIVDESVKEAQNTFGELANKYSQTIHIIPVDSYAFSKYPTNENWSKAIYYRLLVADLLPESCDKVIYFDCDIICNVCLRDLWSVDVTDYAIAGVVDAWSKSLYAHVGLTDETEYFNSGVLLINLNYWRKNNVGEACMAYLYAHADDLWCPDQDVLNAVCRHTKLLLPMKFNFQISFLKLRVYENLNKILQKEIVKYKAFPSVIHYAYATKPWMMLYHKKMPYYYDWHKYKNMSLWSRTKKVLPKNKKINWIIKRYVLWPLGIMYNQEFMCC